MMNEQCGLPSFSIFSDRQFLDVFRTFCYCWRSTGDYIEMLESPAECARIDSFAELSLIHYYDIVYKYIRYSYNRCDSFRPVNFIHHLIKTKNLTS